MSSGLLESRPIVAAGDLTSIAPTDRDEGPCVHVQITPDGEGRYLEGPRSSAVSIAPHDPVGGVVVFSRRPRHHQTIAPPMTAAARTANAIQPQSVLVVVSSV